MTGVSHAEDPESLQRGELEKLQLERLMQTVARVYESVPYYRAKFDSVGVGPNSIQSLEDVSRLPLTSKEDLRATYPFGMFAVPMNEVARVHASSGTTGRPTLVGYTRRDLATWGSLMARCLRVSGVEPGMKVHNAYGYGLFTGGLGAHQGIEALGAVEIPISGGFTARQVQLIVDLEPEVILCTPSYLLTILDEMEAQRIDPRATSLRIGILGAEPWSNEMRYELEDRLRIDALDIYGLSEVIGPGVANECVETKDGPHIWEDHFLPEVIDSDGNPLPDGEYGELVLTSLTKEAFPVLRYRTRDITRLLPGTARPAMRRMEKVTGRNDDMIILRGVNLFPTQIEELVLATSSLSPHFILELKTQERLDALSVRVERKPGVSDEDAERGQQDLEQALRGNIGVTIGVSVEPVGSLPRSEGKVKRLYDLRENGK